jgi:hypothetical protein
MPWPLSGAVSKGPGQPREATNLESHRDRRTLTRSEHEVVSIPQMGKPPAERGREPDPRFPEVDVKQDGMCWSEVVRG